MKPEWPAASVIELQRQGILLVEDGNHGEYRPRPDEFVNNGVAFIRAADLESGRVLFGSASKINGVAMGRISKGIGAPGDVLLSHKGTVGKVAITPLLAPEFVCSPQTTFWRTLDQDRLDRRYLYAFLRSPGFGRQLASRAAETDMAPYVSLTSQRGLTVVVPPISEQRQIGHILGMLDDKVEANLLMNETLENLGQNLLLGFVKDDESVATLDDVCSLSREGIDPAALGSNLVEHYSLPAFDNGRRPVVESATDIKSNKLRVPADSILVSKLNPQIPRVWLPWLSERAEALASTEWLVLRPRDRRLRSLVYAVCASDAMRRELAGRATGTTGSHQRVTPEDVMRIEIRLPDTQRRVPLAGLLDALYAVEASNTRESHTLVQLRDLLLPKLVSGDLRVKEAEELVEEVL